MTQQTLPPPADLMDRYDSCSLLIKQVGALHIGINHILAKLTDGHLRDPKEASRSIEQAQMLSGLMGTTLDEIKTIQKEA